MSSSDQAAAASTATIPGNLPKKSGERCEAAKAGSQERARGAVEACVSFSPSQARTAAAPQSTAPQALAASGSCSVSGVGNYSYARFSYCVSGLNVVYILRDGNGVEIGRGTLEVATSATLPASGTTWNEQVTVKMTAAQGDVTALSVKFRSACTAGCKATKNAPWWTGNLTVGQSPLTGTVTYSSAPAAGAVAEFSTSYQMYVTMPGATITDPNASWTNPRKIRCDDAVGGTSTAGCAIPSEMPVVAMKATSSDPGGAIAAYDWAQKNLDGGWGKKGSPLTRSTIGVAARTAATCSGFTAQTDLVDADSCGDFPFGEVSEGGTAGNRCVNVIPHLDNGEWATYVLNDAHVLDRTSPCVQAHVTPTDKQFADTQLADGFRDQRIIHADKFELTLSTPDTGPKASCLSNPRPIGALPNGGGWFKNTTEPVPLINQTNPSDGPGKRPTQAQACLGRNTDGGTGTSDPITGWKDAEEFKKASNVTNGLARCHLIAKVLGGQGTSELTRYNLVPCWQSGMNTGTPSMRTFETKAQDLIKGPIAAFGANDAVFYEVTPVYKDANSTIPVGVTMHATVQRANGTTEELFPNVYVTNTLQNTGTLNLGN
ncbi:DNA/RNA non-specific endonuclease [Streptomyces subrutilus]|uniref:DNA/RNA non-specific endonuclease n=1 Tax=Streptomyces subrutilus TaxID=36818 RepID=UPI0033D64C8C